MENSTRMRMDILAATVVQRILGRKWWAKTAFKKALKPKEICARDKEVALSGNASLDQFVGSVT